jgi:hypothetical protein
MADFLCLVFAGAQVNSNHEVKYPRITLLIKDILFSGDIFLTLLLATKLVPALSKSTLLDGTKDPISKGFHDLIKPSRPSSGHYMKNRALQAVRTEVQKIIEWTERMSYF